MALVRFPIYISLLVFLSCTRLHVVQTDDMGPEAGQFFKGWFHREVAAGLHYRRPGYCFRQIRKTVPREWWRYAVEGLYYRLPEVKDAGQTDKWLDTAQVILPDPNVLSFLQMIRGTRSTAEGDYTAAQRYLQDSYALALRCGQKFRANDAKRYLARCLKLRGEYPEAISLLMEVNYFFLDKPDFPHEVRKYETKLELARVYQISGDYPQALHWSRQAVEYARRNKAVGQEVEATEYLALVFLNMGRAEEAWEVLREAHRKRRTFAIYADSSNGFFLRGKALAELKRYQEALPLLRIAESTNLETKNRQKIAETDAAIADCFLGMRQPDTALAYYRKSLALMPNISRQSYLHYKIADIFERKGLTDSALYHTQRGAQLFRVFFSADKDRTIGRIEAKAELERKATQVRILTEQQRSQKIKIALLFLVLLSGIATLVLLLDRQRRKRAILEKEKELLQAYQTIQQQELQIANTALTEKTAEVATLQNLLDLKNQLISSLEQRISTPNQVSDNNMTQPLRMLTELDWQEFREAFEQEFPHFILRLKQTFERLTNSDIRLFIFIKIGLESPQIANISGISIESVYRNRSRLRQRLGLDNNVSLDGFIRDF